VSEPTPHGFDCLRRCVPVDEQLLWLIVQPPSANMEAYQGSAPTDTGDTMPLHPHEFGREGVPNVAGDCARDPTVKGVCEREPKADCVCDCEREALTFRCKTKSLTEDRFGVEALNTSERSSTPLSTSDSPNQALEQRKKAIGSTKNHLAIG